MQEIKNYFSYAEVALASYAPLIAGVNQTEAYRDAGMTLSQAQEFDSSWIVISQQGLLDGFNATLFQRIKEDGSLGEKVLAIRGTDGLLDLATDIINIALLGSYIGMPQYALLREFYLGLVFNGKIDPSEQIVVTGHSLGGFLAQAFATEFDSAVSAAYTYNAPGFSAAPIGNLNTEFLSLFGIVEDTVPNEKIFNIVAGDGLSGTAGLGQMFGSVEMVRIERGNPIHNHGIATTTDALALYDLIARVDASVSMAHVGAVVAAASDVAEQTLERLVDALARIFGVSASAQRQIGNRDVLYQAIYDIRSVVADRPGLEFISLTDYDASTLEALSYGDIAHRYALKALNPFAILGTDYGAHNEDGELDVYDEEVCRRIRSRCERGTTRQAAGTSCYFISTNHRVGAADQLMA